MAESYYENLPRKRMASGVLFFNEQGELLVLKPSYKDHWTIPGGVVEKDESPKVACLREIREEIGLEIEDIDFVCVNYLSDQGKTESLQFIFNGGILNKEKVEKIKVQENEIVDYKFLPIAESLKILSPRLANRISHSVEAIKNKTGIYLEN